MKLLLALVVATAPSIAAATTVRYQTEPEMVAHAAVVVRGTVESVSARRHPSGVIVTDVTLRVARLLKANRSADRISFVQLGGALDGVRLNVPGRSHYTRGEEVIVFLERAGEDLVEIGVGAGKFQVLRPPNKPATVARDLGDLNFVRYRGRRGDLVAAPRNQIETLESFEARMTVWAEEG